jgi:HAD superfamily hydrolase (TIGR01509 family)
MKKKAFIFDMDGVMIDSETEWIKLFNFMSGHGLGQSIDSSYLEAKKAQPKLNKEAYLSQLNDQAQIIYRQAPLTPQIDDLIDKLVSKNFRLAIVSGSMGNWIARVNERLRRPIETTISVHDQPDLKVKPAPDGYLEAMRLLKVKPDETIILEDSNLGIKAGKAAGAFVICLTELHPKDYHPQGADLYVKNISELLAYLDSIQV